MGWLSFVDKGGLEWSLHQNQVMPYLVIGGSIERLP